MKRLNRPGISRRDWMKSTAGLAALAASGLPNWFIEETLDAAETPAPTTQNDKPSIALIGCGGRGRAVAHDALPFFNIVAVCDVDDGQAHGASIDFKGATPFHDFRKVMERDDIHAVINATPDHWHTLVNIHAMKMGKDVYSEKPLTLTIDEGKHVIAAATQTKRILQTGSQQRSDPNFRLAVDCVRNGRIGKLQEVAVILPMGLQGGPFKEAPVPKELDWDMWQGQTAVVPYVPQKCRFSFRYWYDYSGGTMTDWGAHHNDIARWAIGQDGPIAIDGRRLDTLIPGGYTAASEYHVEFTWAGGIRQYTTSTPSDEWNGAHKHDGINEVHNGVKFHGDSKGKDGKEKWIFVTRGKIEASHPEILTEPFASDAFRAYDSSNHMGNFFDCIKSRKPAAAVPEIGHRSASVCHLGTISVRLGRKLQWDPVAEQFIGDEEANKWVKREMRKEWSYETV